MPHLSIFIGIHALSIVMAGVILFEYRRVLRHHCTLMQRLEDTGIPKSPNVGRVLIVVYVASTLFIVAGSTYFFFHPFAS